MSAITIFACESQPIVLEGLCRVLEGLEDLQLVGVAASVPEGMSRIATLKPQIVLLDQAGGLKQVFRYVTDIKTALPGGYPVLWVSELAEVECFRALQLGVRGIVRKNLGVDQLVDCLRAVARGSIWIEHTVSNQVVGLLGRRQAPRLTPREREIVRCLCQGMRNKEIARELSITPGTVKVHLMHIFEKTGVKDRFELAMYGRKMLGLDLESEAEAPTDSSSTGS